MICRSTWEHKSRPIHKQPQLPKRRRSSVAFANSGEAYLFRTQGPRFSPYFRSQTCSGVPNISSSLNARRRLDLGHIGVLILGLALVNTRPSLVTTQSAATKLEKGKKSGQ
jgi:hypothetical protein